MKKKLSLLIVGFLIWNQALGYGALSMRDLSLPKDFFPAPSPNVTIDSEIGRAHV